MNKNMETLIELEKTISTLLNSVQQNLGVEPDKLLDPTKVIEEATGSQSSGFMTKLLGAEAAAILGSMMAATVLLGGKKKRTKGRKNILKKKKTKKAHKV